MAISCGSIKLWHLSNILDDAILLSIHLAILLKRLDSLYLSMYSLSHLGCFGINLWNKIFLLSFITVDNRLLHCLYLIWALFFKVISFNFTYLVSRWILMEIDFYRPRVVHGLFLKINICLEIFLRGAYKTKIETKLVRKLIKDWFTFPLLDLIKFFQSTGI